MDMDNTKLRRFKPVPLLRKYTLYTFCVGDERCVNEGQRRGLDGSPQWLAPSQTLAADAGPS